MDLKTLWNFFNILLLIYIYIYLNSQKIFWQQMVVYKIIKLKNIFVDFQNIYLLIGFFFRTSFT
jgi:hypothetical protein